MNLKIKITSWLIVFSLFGGCAKVNTTFRSAQKQLKVPVLKGKKNNPILLIKLAGVATEISSSIKSVHISLKGTSDLNDVKSLDLFYLGSDSLWESEKKYEQVGGSQSPAWNIVFEDNIKLAAKENHFLVTCKLDKKANLHNKISAYCDKIVFAEKSHTKPIQHSLPIKQRIGFAVRKHMDDNVHTYRIPGLATTNKGTLLGIYDVRRNSSRDLQGDIDIGVSRSIDGGNSWEPMKIALDKAEWGGLPQKFNGVADACILVDGNSDNIFIAGLWMFGVLDENGKWTKGLTEQSDNWEHQWRRKGSQAGFDVKRTSQFLLAKSTDDGKTWEAPINLTRQIKRKDWWLFAPAPGRGITLKDGTLLMPTEGRDAIGTRFSNFIFSIDGGQNWQTSNPAYSGTNENQAVQLADGSIMLNMRYGENRNNDSDTNGRVVAVTHDLGQTWKEHSTSRNALIESGCMASLHKHVYSENGQSKHILLFSNPSTKKGRHHTTIKVSFDDGETWPEDFWFLLDEGDNRGYSCLTSIDEQTIGILYEGSQADMTFESIPLNELLNR
jgi:sialidase-1